MALTEMNVCSSCNQESVDGNPSPVCDLSLATSIALFQLYARYTGTCQGCQFSTFLT